MSPTTKAARRLRMDKRTVNRLKYWVPEPSPDAELSPRELEVAILLAQGFSHLNIATKLGITEATSATHANHIYRKLGGLSRAELTHCMIYRGWVENIYGDPKTRHDKALAGVAVTLLDLADFVEKHRQEIELIAAGGPNKHPHFMVTDAKTA